MKKIKLRKLIISDAKLMLEWIRNPKINQYFQFDAEKMDIHNTEDFIKDTIQNYERRNTLHYAISDETNEYLGTISLKNIDEKAKSAEYAIVLRKKAQGYGIATNATKLLLAYGFNELGLNRIYLNVFSDNEVAISLYRRCGFEYEGEFREHIWTQGKIHSLSWFSILYKEYEKFAYEDNAK